MADCPVFCAKDCGGNACPLQATVVDGHVVRIANNPAGAAYLKGCRRGFDLGRERESPERLLKPLIRTGARGSGQFREATWDEALGLVAARLQEVRAQHGPHGVLDLSSAGCTGALHGTLPLMGRFLNLWGGATRLKGSYSIAAAHFVLPYVFGPDWKQTTGLDPATFRHSRMIILWGANVLETRHGAAVTPHLLEAKARGAEIVVIDPRRTATARRAGTWWIPCRPGTDAALMLAVLHVLLAEGLADHPFIARHAAGFDELERYVADRTPAWAAGVCGVPAEEIVRFARAYAAAKPALLLPGYSIQRVFAGEEPFRLAAALQLATGNLGRPGGSTGAPISRLPNPRVGTLPVPEVPGQPILPINDWPGAILGDRGLRAVYSIGGNLLNQGPDIAGNIAAFERLDFAVCHDLFLTPTARHCDVVLPAAHVLEREDIGIPWLGNYLTYAPQAVQPRGQARTDYDILCELAGRMGFEAAFSEGRSAAQWIQHFLDQSEIPDPEAFRRTGLYLAPDQERVGLADFARDPVAHPLGTPSGRVEIGSPAYARDTGFPAIPQWREAPGTAHPLRLVTPKVADRTHSQTAGMPMPPHPLALHPRDAEARGLAEGCLVEVFSDHGRVRVPLRLDPDLMPGVACLVEGAWLDLDPDGIDRAGSANVLTGTAGTEPSRACAMSGVPVEVRRALPGVPGSPCLGTGGHGLDAPQGGAQSQRSGT